MIRRISAALAAVFLAHAVTAGPATTNALLSLAEVHARHGRQLEAMDALKRLDAALPAGAVERADLAAAYQRFSAPEDALAVWERLARDSGPLPYESQSRLATLYESLQKPARALEAWQALWEHELLPAQRSIVEDRLVTLGATTGLAAELAAGLEARLARAAARRNDFGLLLRLYANQGHVNAALELVDEYIGDAGPIVERLKEQARIHRLMSRYEDYDAVMQRLAAVDPKHEIEYLRSRIVAHVERQKDMPVREVRKLLGRLRELEIDASGGEFEGEILMRAGLVDEAMQAYRRALARQPGNPDLYLLLGEAMRMRQLRTEALAMFQAMAQRAQNDRMFVAAIDGILNMSVNVDAQVDGYAVLKLRPARRAILERLITGPDRMYLYELVADVSGEIGMPLDALHSIEASVASAGTLRGAALRQLLTLTTPDDGGDSGNLRSEIPRGDALHVAFGRRLAAVTQALPPDVYVDLGTKLLQARDLAGAARAFASAENAAGNTDVATRAAQLYDAAGYERDALAEYRRALLGSGGNPAIALRLARLLERMGERRQANEQYGSALRTVLMQQPATAQPAREAGDRLRFAQSPRDATETWDYRAYFADLRRGYLATWPADPMQSDAQWQSLTSWLTAELQSSGDDAREHPRLERIRALVQLAAEATGRTADVASTPGVTLPFGPQRAPKGSLEESLNLALLSRDQSRLLETTRRWARAGRYTDAVEWADGGRLEPRRFASLCRYVAHLLRQDESQLELMLSRRTDLLMRIEAVTGEPVLAGDAWLDRLTRDPKGNAEALSNVNNRPMASYLARRLSHEQALELFRFASVPRRADAAFYPLLYLWGALLEQPLEPQLSARLEAAFTMLLVQTPGAMTWPPLVTEELLLPNPHPGNVGLADRIAERWRVQAQSGISYNRPLNLLHEGRITESLDALIEVTVEDQRIAVVQTDSTRERPLERLREIFMPGHASELARRLDAYEAREGESPASMRARSYWFAPSGPHERIEFFSRAAGVDPGNAEYGVRLFNALMAEQRFPEAIDVMQGLLRLDPDNMIYYGALFAAFRKAGRPADALQLNAHSPEDMRSPQFFWNLVLRMGQRPGPERLIELPQDLLAGGDSASDADAALRRMEKALDAPDPELARRELRGAWLKVTEPADPRGVTSGTTYEGLFSRRDLMGRFARYDFAIDEFEDYLRSATPQQYRAVEGLYPALAQAYVIHDRAERELEVLRELMAKGRARARDLSLWLALLEAMPGVPTPDSLSELDRRLRHPNELSERQLSAMARLYARARRPDDALEAYRLLAAKGLGLASVSEEAGSSAAERGRALTALGLVDEISQHLDAGSRQRALADIVLLVDPGSHASPLARRRFELFCMRAWRMTLDEKAAAAKLIGALGTPVSDWRTENLLEAMQIFAAAGDTEHATRALEAVVRIDSAAEVAAAIRDLEQDKSGISELSNYFVWLGFPALQSAEGSALFDPDMLLGKFADVKATAEDLRRTASVLARSRGQPGVAQNRVLNLLAVTARRQHDLGDAVFSAATFGEVSSLIALGVEHYGNISLTVALSAAEDASQSLPLSTLELLARARRLSGEQAARAVRRVAQRDGIPLALAMGERVGIYTHDEDLLDALADLSAQMADPLREAHWRKEREITEAARKDLEAH